MSEDYVKVAVRVRPLVASEIEKGCQNCISVVPGEPQIQMNGTEESFTYNYVFGSDVDQEQVYNSSVKDMIDEIFKGYNITILAYGQTGSGKTHSMGTNDSSTGIIPRAVRDMFEKMSSKEHDDWSFRVTVSFMELYNEKLYDLLGDETRKDRVVEIRGDTNGFNKVVGSTEHEVKSSEDVLNCLVLGSQGRATAMNAQSSRSHAIFSITVNQYKKKDSNSGTTSKFHLVDLAGSGVLTLGNLISRLGDNASYVDYRESKLTRLLQDSLGGNSITLMIACVSPADYNFEETLSTLRHAERARKIKNKPIINQDTKAAEINRLTALVKDLKLEHGDLVERNRSLRQMIRELNDKLIANLMDSAGMQERTELAEQSREKLLQSIVGFIEDIQDVMKETDIEVIHSKHKKIHEKLVKLQDHQKQSEAEMTHQISLEENMSIKKESDATTDDDSLTELTLDEEHREHTLLQAKRNEEVNKVSRALAEKTQKKRNLEMMDVMEKYEAVVAERDVAMKMLRDIELLPKISLEEHQKILEEARETWKKQYLESQGASSSIERRRKNSGRKTLATKPSSTVAFCAELEKENTETDDSSNDDQQKDPDFRSTPPYWHRKNTSRSLKLPAGTIRKRSLESIDGNCQCKLNCRNNYCKCRKSRIICDNECRCNPRRCENRNNENQTSDSDDDPFDGQARKMKT